MDNCNLHGAEPIQFGGIVPGVFNPALAKHSKSFSLIDCISVGVDRMQRNFEPIRKQVEAWQRSELTDVTFKVVIYEGFLEGKLEVPKHLARSVPGPQYVPSNVCHGVRSARGRGRLCLGLTVCTTAAVNRALALTAWSGWVLDYGRS
jgi:hypothetical protein